MMKSKNTYALPLKKYAIFLAISDPRAHHSHWKHAVDFSIDLNVPILASLEGEIVDVKDDSSEGGNDEKYADIKYQNFITIKHANNEFSQYGHIAHKSSLVKIGDKVKFVKGDNMFEQVVDSMQVEHASLPEAKAGQEIGIKVNQKTKEGTVVYTVPQQPL